MLRIRQISSPSLENRTGEFGDKPVRRQAIKCKGSRNKFEPQCPIGTNGFFVAREVIKNFSETMIDGLESKNRNTRRRLRRWKPPSKQEKQKRRRRGEAD
jgi:hypothetical protein